MADQRGPAFDSASDLYQQARPEYPEQLYEAMIAAAGLGADDRLLEIGCASGNATLPLWRPLAGAWRPTVELTEQYDDLH